jgi:outer membrane biosynthesis protein TonB
MATERDLELLDDYLSGRMDAEGRASFEGKLNADTELQQAHDLQSQLIEGIRQARISELKALLNNTPVPAISTGSTLLKAGAWVLVAAAAATGVYYWLGNNDPLPADTPVVSAPADSEPSTDQSQEPTVATQQPEPHETAQPKTETENKSSESEASKPVKKPDVRPYEPTSESDDSRPDNVVPQVDNNTESPVVASTVEVEIDNSSRKLDFHYQFRDNKLILFGTFEKDLYTILEFFHENKRTVFLNYNSSYYLLDESKDKPTPLKAVTDPALLQKLKEFRGN